MRGFYSIYSPRNPKPYTPSHIKFQDTGLKPSEDSQGFMLQMDVPGTEREFIGLSGKKGHYLDIDNWFYLETSHVDDPPFSMDLRPSKLLYVGEIKAEHGKAYLVVVGRSEENTLLIGSLFPELNPSEDEQPHIYIQPNPVDLIEVDHSWKKAMRFNMDFPYENRFVDTNMQVSGNFQIKLATFGKPGNFFGRDGQEESLVVFDFWRNLEVPSGKEDPIFNDQEGRISRHIGQIISQEGKIYTTVVGRSAENTILLCSTYHGSVIVEISV